MPAGSTRSSKSRSSTCSSAPTTRSRRSSSARSSARRRWTIRTFASGCCDDGRRAWLRGSRASSSAAATSRAPTSARQGRQHQPRARSSLAALPEPPDFISILDADFVPMPRIPDARAGAVPRRRRRHRPDAAAFHQSRPDPGQSVAARCLAGRAALLLRRGDGVEGCLGCGLLLRHIVGHPLRAAAGDRRLSDRFRHGGLSPDAAPEGGGYTTSYLNEPLTLGLAPEGLKEYITQRGRWCLGFMQIVRGRSGPFSRTSQL